MTPVCSNCGHHGSSAGVAYCGKCGTRISHPVLLHSSPNPAAAARIDAAVRRYQNAGFRLVARTDITAHLTRPKLATRHYLLAALLGFVVLIAYIPYYHYLKKDDDIHLELDAANRLHARGRGVLRSRRWMAAFVVGVSIAGTIVVLIAGGIWSIFFNNLGPDSGWGVHVCSQTDFVRKDDMCVRTSSMLTTDQLSTAVLDVTGKNGGNFSSSYISVVVATMNSDRMLQEAGRTTLSSQLAYNTESWPLKPVLQAAGVTVKPGRTYQIEVDEGASGSETLLGTTTFTVPL